MISAFILGGKCSCGLLVGVEASGEEITSEVVRGALGFTHPLLYFLNIIFIHYVYFA